MAKSIMIVEDDHLLRCLIGMWVAGENYSPTYSFPNGVEALTFYKSHPGEIDLIITDVDMPKMGGVELAERIREMNPEQRMLFMSGNFRPALLAPQYGFLGKPFRLSELLAAIERALANNLT